MLYEVITDDPRALDFVDPLMERQPDGKLVDNAIREAVSREDWPRLARWAVALSQRNNFV